MLLVYLSLVFTVFFYWFAYRPSKIRSECASSSFVSEISDRAYQNKESFYQYEQCLHQWGLKE